MAECKIASATIDGEAGAGVPTALTSTSFGRAHDHEAILTVLDLLELDGEDWRERPLEARKKQLDRLIRKSEGLQYSEHLEGDGALNFKQVCAKRLEGIVSKRRDKPYVSGRARRWIK